MTVFVRNAAVVGEKKIPTPLANWKKVYILYFIFIEKTKHFTA
jgi:hypothetical protein